MKTFYQSAINTLVSATTTNLIWFGVTIWVYLQTRSVLVTSILSAGYMIGLISTSIYFGSLVDHHKKKLMMIVSEVLSLVSLVFALFVYLSVPVSEFSNPASPILWLFLLLLFIGIIIANIRAITIVTLVTILVPEDKRDKANGLVGTTTGVSYVIAPMLGGFLIAISGMYWILVFSIVLRVITTIHMFLLKIEEKLEFHDNPNHKRSMDIKGTFKIILGIPGLLALLLFNSLNNFLSGVFMPLIDPYGLSLMPQQIWGVMSGSIGLATIIGGVVIAKRGLGKNPLRTVFLANIILWIDTIFFAIQPSAILLGAGMFVAFVSIPFIEAAEQTIIQKVVPKNRQGRVVGFAQSVEWAASPLSSLAVGPIAQFIFIPFMTTGAGVLTIGSWFGVGDGRGIALMFIAAGIFGLIITVLGMRSKSYKLLSKAYLGK